jgi:hypothetical protein
VKPVSGSWFLVSALRRLIEISPLAGRGDLGIWFLVHGSRFLVGVSLGFGEYGFWLVWPLRLLFHALFVCVSCSLCSLFRAPFGLVSYSLWSCFMFTVDASLSFLDTVEYPEC